MSTESMISILQQIRDQQKTQLANFERAMETQAAATEIQRRGQRTLLALIVMPWLLVIALGVLLFLE